MSNASPPPSSSPRAQRLAEALRANLHRRKQQQRERRGMGQDAAAETPRHGPAPATPTTDSDA